VNPVRRLSEAPRELRWAQGALELALLVAGILLLVRDLDRVVGVYEANERTLVIRDRNNQVFVDDMYTRYLLDSGLFAPRLSHNLPQLAKPMQEFAERVAMPVGTASDRLWQPPSDAPERAVLANKVWLRGFVGNSAIAQSKAMAGEIRDVREAIVAELARRWPR
jgi:hypothetical protein